MLTRKRKRELQQHVLPGAKRQHQCQLLDLPPELLLHIMRYAVRNIEQLLTLRACHPLLRDCLRKYATLVLHDEKLLHCWLQQPDRLLHLRPLATLVKLPLCVEYSSKLCVSLARRGYNYDRLLALLLGGPFSGVATRGMSASLKQFDGVSISRLYFKKLTPQSMLRIAPHCLLQKLSSVVEVQGYLLASKPVTAAHLAFLQGVPNVELCKMALLPPPLGCAGQAGLDPLAVLSGAHSVTLFEVVYSDSWVGEPSPFPSREAFLCLDALRGVPRVTIHCDLGSPKSLEPLCEAVYVRLVDVSEPVIGYSPIISTLTSSLQFGELRHVQELVLDKCVIYNDHLLSLVELPELRILTIRFVFNEGHHLTSLFPLTNCSALKKLTLSGLHTVRDVSPLCRIPQLTLRDMWGVADVSCLNGVSRLKLIGLYNVTTVVGLGSVPHLTLESMSDLTSLKGVACSGQQHLHLKHLYAVGRQKDKSHGPSLYRLKKLSCFKICGVSGRYAGINSRWSNGEQLPPRTYNSSTISVEL